MKNIIQNLYLYLFRDRKKIESINLKCVIKTNIIFQIIKLIKYLEISFIRLIKRFS